MYEIFLNTLISPKDPMILLNAMGYLKVNEAAMSNNIPHSNDRQFNTVVFRL